MDDRDFPLTMNKPQRHEFEISCQCEPCKAIVQRQMKCTHSMIGKSPICVHCGCTEANKNKYDEMMATAFPWGGMGWSGRVNVNVPKQYKATPTSPGVPQATPTSPGVPQQTAPCGCQFSGGTQTFWCKQHNGPNAVNVPPIVPHTSVKACGCLHDPNGVKIYVCKQHC
jgi:hypothetical protein